MLEVVDDPAVTLREIAGALRPGGQVSVATANRAGAVLARAVAGHPVEALALLEDRDPAPARARPRRGAASPRRTCSPSSRAPGCAPGPWRGVSVVADLLERRLRRRPGGASAPWSWPSPSTSPYRDIATGLHVLAARP